MATLRKITSTASNMTLTVHKLQNIIGYRFTNAEFGWEAVQAPGSLTRLGELNARGLVRHSRGWQRLPDGNRRLAVLGDTVLKLALVEDWYQGDAIRERLSRLVSDVGSNDNLDKQGRTRGLDRLININPSQEHLRIGGYTLATTVEAIIGAVYLDSGMRSVPLVMENLGLMPRIIRKTASGSRRFDKATGTASEEGLTMVNSTATSDAKKSELPKSASALDTKESAQKS